MHPQLQIVDKLVAVFFSLFTCILCATTDAVWYSAQKTADFSAVAPLRQGRSFPCRGAEFDHTGFSVQQTTEIPPVAVH